MRETFCQFRPSCKYHIFHASWIAQEMRHDNELTTACTGWLSSSCFPRGDQVEKTLGYVIGASILVEFKFGCRSVQFDKTNEAQSNKVPSPSERDVYKGEEKDVQRIWHNRRWFSVAISSSLLSKLSVDNSFTSRKLTSWLQIQTFSLFFFRLVAMFADFPERQGVGDPGGIPNERKHTMRCRFRIFLAVLTLWTATSSEKGSNANAVQRHWRRFYIRF